MDLTRVCMSATPAHMSFRTFSNSYDQALATVKKSDGSETNLPVRPRFKKAFSAPSSRLFRPSPVLVDSFVMASLEGMRTVTEGGEGPFSLVAPQGAGPASIPRVERVRWVRLTSELQMEKDTSWRVL